MAAVRRKIRRSCACWSGVDDSLDAGLGETTDFLPEAAPFCCGYEFDGFCVVGLMF